MQQYETRVFNTMQQAMKRDNVTLAEAAEITGKSKSTISKRLVHKDLNKRPVAEKNADGEWQINLHSLMTQYKVNPDKIKILEEIDATGATVHEIKNETPFNSEFNTGNSNDLKDLQHKVEIQAKDLQHFEEKLADKDKTIEEIKADKRKVEAERDEYKEESKTKNQALLTFQGKQEKKTALKAGVSVAGWLLFLVLVGLVAAAIYFDFVKLPTGQGGAEQYPPEITTPQQ